MQAVPGGRPGPEVVARGGNIVRAAVINGGGATDFCARFLDGEYRPVKDITVTLADR
jgi:hypothetical protein